MLNCHFRKLKNRVAAQTARDRKKQRMDYLEEALAQLEAENKQLLLENDKLKLTTGDYCSLYLYVHIFIHNEICIVNPIPNILY